MDKETLSVCSAIALNSIFGYEPRFSHGIISSLGSAEAVFCLSEREKLEIFGPFNKFVHQINEESLRAAQESYRRLTDQGCRVCTIFDEGYPELLRDCDDAPLVLYVRGSGDFRTIFGRKSVSVVGTRDISLYGQEWCTRIVRSLAQTEDRPVITSGLAIGVDITAHRAALDCGLQTIAVLPCGIDDVYPARHRKDAARIASTPGCALITDYPPGTAPVAFNFLRRNRIIAGLSGATVLVESKAKGGGTMTARLASDYGRDVFALPGRIDDLRSSGCNRLIAEKIAEPIDNLARLADSLGMGRYRHTRAVDLSASVCAHFQGRLPDEQIATACAIAEKIRKSRGIDIDTLCSELDLSYAAVSTLAAALESDGFIIMDLMQRCTINAGNY